MHPQPSLRRLLATWTTSSFTKGFRNLANSREADGALVLKAFRYPCRITLRVYMTECVGARQSTHIFLEPRSLRSFRAWRPDMCRCFKKREEIYVSECYMAQRAGDTVVRIYQRMRTRLLTSEAISSVPFPFGQSATR